MDNLFNCDLEWNENVKREMSLATMLDTYLYKEKISYPVKAHKPYKTENCKSGLFGLNYIYSHHKDFVLELIEIFFPTLLFSPNEIRDPKSNEYHLFQTLWAVEQIVWYRNIESSRPRGYEKEKKRLENAINFISRYADYGQIVNSIEFPPHQNEVLIALSDFFKRKGRKQQGDKIITKIKTYFKIDKITPTGQIKIKNANKRLYEKLEKRITDEESLAISRAFLLGEKWQKNK